MRCRSPGTTTAAARRKNVKRFSDGPGTCPSRSDGASAQVRPSPRSRSRAPRRSRQDLQATWRGPATLVKLGPLTAVGLLLGWRLGSKGAAPALRRILYYPLADLLAGAHAGGTLAELTRHQAGAAGNTAEAPRGPGTSGPSRVRLRLGAFTAERHGLQPWSPWLRMCTALSVSPPLASRDARSAFECSF